MGVRASGGAPKLLGAVRWPAPTGREFPPHSREQGSAAAARQTGSDVAASGGSAGAEGCVCQGTETLWEGAAWARNSLPSVMAVGVALLQAGGRRAPTRSTGVDGWRWMGGELHVPQFGQLHRRGAILSDVRGWGAVAHTASRVNAGGADRSGWFSGGGRECLRWRTGR